MLLDADRTDRVTFFCSGIVRIQVYAMTWLSSAVEKMHRHHEADGGVLRETLEEELELCFSIEASMRLSSEDVQVSLLAIRI